MRGPPPPLAPVYMCSPRPPASSGREAKNFVFSDAALHVWRGKAGFFPAAALFPPADASPSSPLPLFPPTLRRSCVPPFLGTHGVRLPVSRLLLWCLAVRSVDGLSCWARPQGGD